MYQRFDNSYHINVKGHIISPVTHLDSGYFLLCGVISEIIKEVLDSYSFLCIEKFLYLCTGVCVETQNR